VLRSLAAEAAELAMLLGAAGVEDTTFGFDDAGPAIVLRGSGAAELVSTVRRFTADATTARGDECELASGGVAARLALRSSER
jgi:hypothetical protein